MGDHARLSCTFGIETCGTVCTEYGGSEAKEVWNGMHKQCDKIGCSICSSHCHSHLDAWEDKIAYDKGKEVKDMKNLKAECEGWSCTGAKL